MSYSDDMLELVKQTHEGAVKLSVGSSIITPEQATVISMKMMNKITSSLVGDARPFFDIPKPLEIPEEIDNG